MEALLYCCCGLDVHKDLIESCILRGKGMEPEIVRCSFGTTKPELKQLTLWLSDFTVFLRKNGLRFPPPPCATTCISPDFLPRWKATV